MLIRYTPLMSLYGSADLEMLARCIFNTVGGGIRVADTELKKRAKLKKKLKKTKSTATPSWQSPPEPVVNSDEVFAQFSSLFDVFATTIYTFLRKLVIVDLQNAQKRGTVTLQTMVEWSMRLYMFNKLGGVDVQSLLAPLTTSQREQVLDELDRVIEHRRRKKQIKAEIQHCKITASEDIMDSQYGTTKLEALKLVLDALQPPELVAIPWLLPAFHKILIQDINTITTSAPIPQ